MIARTAGTGTPLGLVTVVVLVVTSRVTGVGLVLESRFGSAAVAIDWVLPSGAVRTAEAAIAAEAATPRQVAARAAMTGSGVCALGFAPSSNVGQAPPLL